MIMTNEELNVELYAKLLQEQETYRGWLLEQSPLTILDSAYEYAVREDFLLALDNEDLDDEQAKALLESDTPLADLFQDWEKRGSNHMTELADCIIERANKLIAQLNPPLYTHSPEYAIKHGESDAYSTSFKANVACRNAIEKAIADHYSNNKFDPAGVKEVIDRFGFERTSYVLANSVWQKDWDGRISPDNKQWAKNIFASEGGALIGHDVSPRFAVSSHPGLLDLFITQARRELLLTLPLTPDDIRQEAQRLLRSMQAQQQPNSPNGTHFMAQVSPAFMLRATSKDLDQLFASFPLRGLSMSTLKDRSGTFVFVPKDTDLNRPLREPKVSVRAKLQDAQPTTAVTKRPVKKTKGQEL